jgi:hypothetical protein
MDMEYGYGVWSIAIDIDMDWLTLIINVIKACTSKVNRGFTVLHATPCRLTRDDGIGIK